MQAKKGTARLPYVNKQMRRSQVLDLALDMCKTRSYQTLTVKGLARELGCHAMTLYRAVGNHQDLHKAIEQKALQMGEEDPRAKPVLMQMAAIGRIEAGGNEAWKNGRNSKP